MDADADQTVTMTRSQYTESIRMAVEWADRRKLRLVLVAGFVAGLLAAALVALPVVFFTAKANCNAITTLAGVAETKLTDEKASNKRFLEKSKDRLGLSEADFQKLIEDNEQRQQREIDATRGVKRRNCALI